MSPRSEITAYASNVAGRDMRHRCCVVERVETAYNWAIEHQMAARSYRIGRMQKEEIIRILDGRCLSTAP